MSDTKRTIIVIGGLILILVACIFAVSAVHKSSQHSKIEASIKVANKQCPRPIDEATTLTSIELIGDTVVYTYDVDHDSLGFSLMDISDDKLKSLQILQQQCNAFFASKRLSVYADEISEVVNYGVAFKYVYRDESNLNNCRAFTISNEELKQLRKDFGKLDREKVAHKYIEYSFSENAPANKKAIAEVEQAGMKMSFKYAGNTVTIDYTLTAKYAQILKEQEPDIAYINNAAILDVILDEIDIDEAKREFAVSFPDKIFVSCARAAYTQFVFNFRSALSDKKVTFTMSANELTMNVPGTNTYQFQQ